MVYSFIKGKNAIQTHLVLCEKLIADVWSLYWCMT